MSEELGTDIRTRRLVKELLEPTIRRAMEDREQLGHLARDVEAVQRKVQDFEFAFAKVYKKLALAEDVCKRQTDLEAAQRGLDSKTAAQAHGLKVDLDSLSATVDQKTSTLGTLEKQVQLLAGQLRDCGDSVLAYRAAAQQDLNRLEAANFQTLEDFRTQLSQARESLEGLDSQQQRVNVLLGDSGAELASQNKQMAALRNRIDRLETEKASIANIGELLAELQALKARALADKEAQERRLRTVLDSLGPYSQLIVLADLLHEVLEPRTLSRLLQVEKHKYKAWLDLATLNPALEPDIRAALQRAEILASRLNSEVFLRTRTQQENSDLPDTQKPPEQQSIQEPSSPWKPAARLPSYSPIPTSSQVASPTKLPAASDFQLAASVAAAKTPLPENTAPVRKPVPVSTVKTAESGSNPVPVSTSSSVPVTKPTAPTPLPKPQTPVPETTLVPDPPHKAESVEQDEASSVYSAQKQEFVAFYTDSESEERPQISTELAELREEVQTRVSAVERLVKESTEACASLVKQVGSECSTLTHQHKRVKADLAVQLGAIQEDLQRLKAEQNTSKVAVERLVQLHARVVECCRIGISLSLQDEADRQSISLMAAGGKPKSAVVSVEKPSALFSSSYIQSAFKVACLAYAPSPVTYRQTVFKRRDLLEVQRRLLEAAWEDVSGSEPWARLDIHRSEVLHRASPNSWSGLDSIISEEPEERKRAVTSLGVRPPRVRSLSSRQK